MTVRDLNKLYYLNKLIERDTQRLAELEARLQPGGMRLSGTPRSPSPRNLIEELVPQIIEIRNRVLREREDYIRERAAIEEYIRSVDDYHIRLILSCRFVDLMSWRRIALLLGGGNTEDSVRKMCHRFLDRSGQGDRHQKNDRKS